MADKKLKYIPKTYLWNSVGINRDGIVNVLEYINLEKILVQNTDLTKEERKVFKEFQRPYLEFLLKELKKIKAIKDETTILANRYDSIYFNIDEIYKFRENSSTKYRFN